MQVTSLGKTQRGTRQFARWLFACVAKGIVCTRICFTKPWLSVEHVNNKQMQFDDHVNISAMTRSAVMGHMDCITILLTCTRGTLVSVVIACFMFLSQDSFLHTIDAVNKVTRSVSLHLRYTYKFSSLLVNIFVVGGVTSDARQAMSKMGVGVIPVQSSMSSERSLDYAREAQPELVAVLCTEVAHQDLILRGEFSIHVKVEAGELCFR